MRNKKKKINKLSKYSTVFSLFHKNIFKIFSKSIFLGHPLIFLIHKLSSWKKVLVCISIFVCIKSVACVWRGGTIFLLFDGEKCTDIEVSWIRLFVDQVEFRYGIFYSPSTLRSKWIK